MHTRTGFPERKLTTKADGIPGVLKHLEKNGTLGPSGYWKMIVIGSYYSMENKAF